MSDQIKYFLAIRANKDKFTTIMNDGEKIISATEENKNLLLDLGKKLLEKGLINRYQLMRAEGEVFGDCSIPN